MALRADEKGKPGPRTTNAEKLAEYNKWRPFFSVREPEVDVLAHVLLHRLTTRVVNNANNKATFRFENVLDIKTILFQLSPLALDLLTSQPFHEISSLKRTPLPDPSKHFPCIYMSSFIEETPIGTKGMCVRDAIRIANVLINTNKLERVLAPVTAGPETWIAARDVGRAWKRTLEDMDLWLDVDEFPYLEDHVFAWSGGR